MSEFLLYASVAIAFICIFCPERIPRVLHAATRPIRALWCRARRRPATGQAELGAPVPMSFGKARPARQRD